ncbi:MAG: histidine phosphatase family protein [Actinomycetota bacterium]|nr:histidine phosphatase family protein [Actinomycetota bacterium]
MLFLVRHGQTAENARGLLLGRQDPPLSEVGRRQAAALARVLPTAHVVSSPLRRARQTAEAFGEPVVVDERWIELDYGDLDGCRPEEVSQDVWARWRTDTSFVPAGGESLAELGNRVRSACEELSAAAAGHDVVVVSHVSPIKAAVAWALAVDENVAWRMFVQDGSVARVAVTENGPLLLSLNEMPSPDD